MTTPPSGLRRDVFVAAIAACAVLGASVVLSPGLVASAADLITGKDIKDGTVKKTDLSPKVRAQLGVPGPKGSQGIQGIQGIQGVQGEEGTDGADGYSAVKLATLTVPLTTSGAQSLVEDQSNTVFDQGDTMKFVSASISGDFSACAFVGSNIIIEDQATPVSTSDPGGVLVDSPYSFVSDDEFVLTGNRHIKVGVWCMNGSFNNIPALPATAEVTVTFEWTHSDPPPVTVD